MNSNAGAIRSNIVVQQIVDPTMWDRLALMFVGHLLLYECLRSSQPLIQEKMPDKHECDKLRHCRIDNL